MSNNFKMIFRNILTVIIIIGILILVAHLFIFLLPIFFFLAIIYYLYILFFKDKFKVKKRKTRNSKLHKENIKEAEVINEKFDE